MEACNLSFSTEQPIPLLYDGITVDCAYRADFIIEGVLILEIKAVETLLPVHEAQLLTYLRLAACPVGLLFNFNVPLLKYGIKRVVNDFPTE